MLISYDYSSSIFLLKYNDFPIQKNLLATRYQNDLARNILLIAFNDGSLYECSYSHDIISAKIIDITSIRNI